MASEELLSLVKETIRASIRRNTKRGFIGWSSCDQICMDMHGCLDQCGELRKEGSALEALEVTVYVLLEGIKLASCADSSSGMLTDVLGRACEMAKDCAEELSGQEKQMRDKALALIIKGAKKKAFDGWMDWRYGATFCTGICLGGRRPTRSCMSTSISASFAGSPSEMRWRAGNTTKRSGFVWKR